MRAKQLASFLPVNQCKLFYDRITLSKLTTAYFIFSVLNCILQAALQIRAFTINKDAASFLSGISIQANATDDRIAALGNGDLRLCSDIPTDSSDLSNCQVIWNGTAKSNTVATTSATETPTPTPQSLSTQTVGPVANNQALPTLTTTTTIVPTVTIIVSTPSTDLDEQRDDHDDDDDEDEEEDLDKRFPKVLIEFDEDGHKTIVLSGDGYDGVNAALSNSCLWALNWPVSILDNTKREDIVFIAFQFWVLGMSIVALLNESIPHMGASLLTHVLSTAWSAFQISHTANFRSTFNTVIVNGACNGVPLLPSYWQDRANAEYPALAFNVVALVVSAFLTWKLVKSFGWQTFKRVGASLTINRIYMLVLVLSIVLQLSFFFMGATVSLWLDSLFNGVASHTADFLVFYKATSFATLVLLIPWIATGWFSVRQELRLPMFIFLVLSLLYLGAWGVMFLSDTFRYTFVTWRFFSLMASASVVLTMAAFIVGVICRYNFGRGLPRYLNAQEQLPGDDFARITGSDIEKVPFPSNEKPIPTFSATFGSGSEVPPPSQMFSSRGLRVGPRFFNPSAEPFESSRGGSPISSPSAALTRDSSLNSGHSDSFGTISSYYSYSHKPSDSQDSYNTKRWVIE